MNLHTVLAMSLLSLFSFGCAVEEIEPDKKLEAEQKVQAVAAKPETVEASAPFENSDQLATVGTPTDTIYPYRRTDEPKSIEVQIVKPNGEPTVTDSADPNLLSGGGANMGVKLMSKKEAAKTVFSDGAVPAATIAVVKITGGVPAEKALSWLKNGNTRFTKGTVRRDGQSAKDRKRVAIKQTPHAFVLACSESVAPPELVFDQKLGEISVARNLGANVDDAVIRGIEDSVQRGTQLVVVLNHTGCAGTSHDAANEISAKSKMLDSLVKSGSLTIKSANYDQDNGRVSF